ncbi:ABC transporter substrate-binding protein, partial [Mesorhizobium sp. M7A.F.Ca.US.006.01.1.1]|uniref:ABC transporter substrate-binding protein n=1 Tax=Mesorhizobium sp. M7A.F.Ca.US.006.01.1.1 TaxID=2496707 RepID=UPI000FD3EB40
LMTVHGTSAQEVPTLEKIIEGAKQEGKLTAWILVPAKPETHRAVIQAFNTRFGLNTEVEWVPNSPNNSNTRVIAEAAAGKVTVDVIGGGNEEEVYAAYKAGVIKAYPWVEVFGKEFPRIKDLEEQVFPDFRSIALPYYVAVWGMAWNPNLIADEDVPDNYTDFADPKWSGKFGQNSYFLSPAPILAGTLGYDETIALAKKIIANKPVYSKGSAGGLQDISNGVVSFGIVLYNHAVQAMNANQPVKYKLFADYMPMAYGHVFVPEGAPHPNGARLFAAWFAAEGYKIAAELEPFSEPANPDSPISKMLEEQVGKGAKVVGFKNSEDIALSAKTRAELSLMLSGQQ